MMLQYLSNLPGNITLDMKFHPKKVSANVYKYNYFPRTISDWNSLPSSVIDFNTIEGFKTALCND